MTIVGKITSLLFFVVALVVLLVPEPALAQRERTDLTLRLIPKSGRFDNQVKVGEDNKFFLEVRNIGTTALTRIRLSTESPQGWFTEIRPGEIPSLSAGSAQTVDIIIRTDNKTAKGGYTILVIAEANEIRKVENIWVTVKTASIWVWVGSIIGVIIVVVFIFIFRHFNRQQQ